jgi:gamma-glutamyl-gamma-aminobutyraldehyde dehydrogenase
MSQTAIPEADLNHWITQAARLNLDGRLLIDGQRVNATDERVIIKKSPIDGRNLPPFARGGQTDVDRAVVSARAAFNDGRWRLQSPARRKAVIVEWSRRVLAAAQELALIETVDMGKPISRALNADVPGTAHVLAWYGEAVDKIYDEIAPTAADSLALITREPLGVIGAIVPWNYPLLMASWKLGPALAAGNSVVLKPSERSPFSALRLAELALEAGLPPGVFNVVTGYGHEAGEALALHPDVDGIGFTGSTRIGKRMFEYAGQSNLKRMYTELGGEICRSGVPRRGCGEGRGGRGRHLVLQPGRVLQRTIPHAGSRQSVQPFCRGIGGANRALPAVPPAGSRRRHGCNGGWRPRRQRDVPHRHRSPRRCSPGRWWAPGT